MKIEEAIEILENGGWWDLLIPITTIERRSDEDKLHQAIDMVLTALRSMPEAGEPLSFEQLRKMDGKPVWIVEYPDWGHWELSEDANDYIVDRNLDFYGMKHDDPDGRYVLHKLGWLAYFYPPAHIDREAWEPCEFCHSCLSCKFSIDDADTESICFRCEFESEYKPRKFCPECGRPFTEEAWDDLEKRLRG